MVDDDESLSGEVPAEVVHDIDDVFAQVALWETGSGSFFSASDRSVIAVASQRLSKTVPTSGAEFAHQIRKLLDDVEATRTTTTEANNEIK